VSALTTTPNDLVHYLLERGLLTPAHVVNGGLTVVPAARRNNNFSVVCGGGPAYFVKSLLPGTSQAAETLRQEAVLYGLAASDPGLAALRAVLPGFRFYDSPRCILVVEHLAGARTLSELHAELGGAAEWTAELAGRVLAEVHRDAAEALPRLDPAVFRRQPPWALSLHHLSPSFGPSGAQLQTLLLTYPEYPRALDAMRAGWRPNTVIHGDMKFDNCLVVERDGAPSLKIVDWELADVGEDMWDVAGILQNYLFWSAVSMQPTAAGEWSVAVPFESVQPAMRAFWNAYASTRGLSAAAAAAGLERGAGYAAARLLQSVMEMLVVSPAMSGHVALLLQTSLNILRDPALMARLVMGGEVADA
jgi:Ser/Thr protein kinase RdoA (MazF antagonist)